jgi:hypothetical protein
LKQFVDLAQDDATRLRARTAAARLGLSIVLHIHAKTGRWAGPHSRAYHPSVVCETPPEVERVQGWIEDGTLPAWLADALTDRPITFTVQETAFIDSPYTITTHHSDSFALGVSATEYSGQSNVFLVHYDRPQADRAGVLYSRYLLNDKWLGDSYHATDRTKSRNLLEEGGFYGVQDGSRAIGLYAPKGDLGLCNSAKAALIWTGREQIDEIWIGSQPIETLPAPIPPGETVVIASGSTLMAIRPLTLTDLGREAPLQLVERAGDLVLELYNYRGPEKYFWEMRWPGAFYQGRPQCGFYAEIAERTAYPNAAAFGEAVTAGELIDQAEAPFVFANQGERLWQVTYSRDDRTLGLEVDLMRWQLKRRWTQAGEAGWPMLESPVARESRSGHVEVGEASLDCGQGAGWLWANPKKNRWVAGYHGQEPAPLTLHVPDGEVHLEGIRLGTIIWDNGAVTIEGIGLSGQPQVRGGQVKSLIKAAA